MKNGFGFLRPRIELNNEEIFHDWAKLIVILLSFTPSSSSSSSPVQKTIIIITIVIVIIIITKASIERETSGSRKNLIWIKLYARGEREKKDSQLHSIEEIYIHIYVYVNIYLSLSVVRSHLVVNVQRSTRIMVEPRWSIKCMNSTLNLLYPCTSFADLKKLHKKYCKKYFCLCKRHTISVICINETRKLYWFNCKNVREKVNFGLGDGYYYKLLRIINGALNTWAQRYIDGLSIARREIMFRINGTAEKNMKLLKEGCYCHYHPHMTADACNADFLKKVVSFWAGEGLRGIREKLRGMTNYAKKVREASELSAFLFYSFLSFPHSTPLCLSCSPSPSSRLPLPTEQ